MKPRIKPHLRRTAMGWECSCGRHKIISTNPIDAYRCYLLVSVPGFRARYGG